ncbi:hypothetical protein PLESTB_001581900 [Pleodorina starrii]|uniref:Galactose oxidase-like Early set domain-containing protein n=1 Tax=Pleodorina starrii TaxID=330485 RepID=A0A9W6BYL5_9CHLO|nr:hypothetical protein PLESTB_001581900 [Pleodorina starrii]
MAVQPAARNETERFIYRFWWTTPGGISKSPTSFAEYRIEIFRPPCWFNLTAKPTIENMDVSTWDEDDGVNVMQYGSPFGLRYSMFYATDRVTTAVLVAPGSTTHSTNMNQRVVSCLGVALHGYLFMYVKQGWRA